MKNDLKDMLNNIPLPDLLDENIKLGFDKGKRKEKKLIKLISFVAASIIVTISTVSIIGIDKVEAAIKQALQYVPGYNLTIDTENGKVLALQESVLYEEDNIFVKIKAASKLGKDLNISIQSNYDIRETSKEETVRFFNSMKIALKDEKGNIVPTFNWTSSSGGSGFWNGDYKFEVEEKGKDYAVLIGELEIPFKLEETKEVDDFLELGPYAVDKGISMVAIKKAMEDKIMISLLNKSEEWKVEDYAFKETGNFNQFKKLGIEESMYLLDEKGNRTYPTLPSLYGNLMSDFYFDTLDRDGLKLVVPYVKIRDCDARTEKIKLEVPKDGEEININKILNLGKFEVEVVSIKTQDDQILINLDIKDLKDEILTDLLVGGVPGYNMYWNEDTGYMEIRINVEDVGRIFSINFSLPKSILKGNWEMDLD